jgi:hypothetical protein
MLLYFFILLFVYFFYPATAHAWGPGAHLEYSLHALSQIALLAPAVRAILKKHPNDFLYGSIAADIILGKKFAGELYHCHHWEVAFPLLDQAEDERQKAFIYGYLTHLSVDTVAHNYFVPFKIIKSFEAYTLRHTYWEMRYDLKMPHKVWDLVKELAEGDYHRNDVLLSRSLKKALFSFNTNKKIFDGLLLIQRMNRWRKAAEAMAARSTYILNDENVHEYKTLCYEVAVDFLQNLDQSRAVQADPTGKLKLLYAKEMVKKLKKYTSRNILSEHDANRLILEIKKCLREGIYKPVELPDIYDVV